MPYRGNQGTYHLLGPKFQTHLVDHFILLLVNTKDTTVKMGVLTKCRKFHKISFSLNAFQEMTKFL